jgi:tRNA U34 5-carboxymethylaminomethyl modifying GTPase MnmE/TrmE
MINKISEGLCVSFEAPDSITGKDVVYAFLLHSKEETKTFVNLLR